MLKQKQRNAFDCCLAASASLMGKVYDDIFSQEFQDYIEAKKGTYGEDVDRVLAMVGLSSDRYEHIVNYVGTKKEFSNWAQVTYRGLLWGRRALIQVPSLNNEGKSHLIAWDYDELWDPSNNKIYTGMDQVLVEHAWVINEKPEVWNEDSNFE
jgi:hypothetical protein